MNHPRVTVIAIKDVTVTVENDDPFGYKKVMDDICKDPVRLKKFMRAVMGPDRRKLEGDEREHMLTVFRLIDPVETSNNQHSFTEVYEHAGKTYHVHSWSDADDEVEEILPDDIQQD